MVGAPELKVNIPDCVTLAVFDQEASGMLAKIIFTYGNNMEAYESGCCMTIRRGGIEVLSAAMAHAVNRSAQWPTVFGNPTEISNVFWAFAQVPPTQLGQFRSCSVEPLRIVQFTKVLFSLPAASLRRTDFHSTAFTRATPSCWCTPCGSSSFQPP